MEGGRSSLCRFPERRVATARVTPLALAQIALECERQASAGKDPGSYATCATILQKKEIDWGEMARGCAIMNEYILDNGSAFQQFDRAYVQNHDDYGRFFPCSRTRTAQG
jgi:hypothetical protein